MLPTLHSSIHFTSLVNRIFYVWLIVPLPSLNVKDASCAPHGHRFIVVNRQQRGPIMMATLQKLRSLGQQMNGRPAVIGRRPAGPCGTSL